MDGVVLWRSGGWRIDHLELNAAGATIHLVGTAVAACCPDCAAPSGRIHSHYLRRLADLPAIGQAVVLKVRVRRFFCDNPACPRRTFAEPLGELAQAHARKTTRLVTALCHLGLVLGGEAGSRLSRSLAMAASGDCILRHLRRQSLLPAGEAQVVGVDEWAWRKRERYGTIICDLQSHKPIDLLIDCSSDSWASWLKAHSSVRIVSRDRGGVYSLGTELGAPQAIQLADRWHLLANCRTALVRLCQRFGREIAVAWHGTQPSSPGAPEAALANTIGAPIVSPELGVAAMPADPKRARRVERYTRVLELHAQGLGYRRIARQMGIGRNTVLRFLRANAFPERRKPRRFFRVARFADHLRRRWEEGCHDARALLRELQVLGFDGSYDMVRRWLRPWRSPADAAHVSGPRPTKTIIAPSERVPSANRVSWWLTQDTADRDEREQRFLDCLLKQCPEMARGSVLAERFRAMVKDRQADRLQAFLVDATATGAPPDLSNFAKGLMQDESAVRAALSTEWSQGQVEGQVNRLKLIKRQMYGRAGFGLLRQRVLGRP